MTTHKPRRTRAQWVQIIEQQNQSGQTIRAFCKENDIGLASFGKWKQKLAKENSEDADHSKPMFRPVSVSKPDEVKTSTIEQTTVTLTFGSNVTLTIQANQPTS